MALAPRPTHWYVFVAVLLFAPELALGIGIIGIPIGLSVALAQALLSLRSSARCRNLPISAIFLCLAVGTFIWLRLNVAIGKRNAVPVVTACYRFNRRHNHYPDNLNQLVPEFIPAIPVARYTAVGRRYAYASDPPALCFGAMFHGVFCYQIKKQSWTAND
jgi:hypothetical protein